MTLEDYLQRAHDLHLRDHLEKPMRPGNIAGVASVHEPMFLEGLEPVKWEPEPGEDLSYLNSPHWLKLQANGGHAKPGNRKTTRENE